MEMDEGMRVGISHTTTTTVNEQNIASAMGSGTLDVFASPALLALMENTALKLVEPYLSEGQTTVGKSTYIFHEKPSSIGETLEARAILATIQERRLTITITVKDSTGSSIGQGTHERIIIDIERFLAKMKR